MTTEQTSALALEGVPHVAVKIIVASEEVATTERESDRGDTAQNVIVGVLHQLAIGTDIEEAARSVIGTGSESVAVREKVHRVDIGLVTLEGLLALASAQIPELGGGVTGTGHKDVLVGGDRHAHHVTVVVVELGHLGTSFHVPQDAGHVTGRGHDLLVADETAATQVAGVSVQLTAHTDGNLAAAQVVDRANVVQTTAGHEGTARRVRAGHHPRGAKRDGVHLVRGETVPHEQLAILRSRHQVGLVLTPVHGVDLGQMTLEGAARLHLAASDRRDVSRELLEGSVVNLVTVNTDLLLHVLRLLAGLCDAFRNVSHRESYLKCVSVMIRAKLWKVACGYACRKKKLKKKK
mmetsp:Transcript_6491/g.19683  ORF Transcript_6491/g.19683 Transcript_6491/m.19683 type:complete len:350 (-) Transcript_6491:117-1166(-)